MPKREIIQFPNAALRRPTKRVKEVDDVVRYLAGDLVESLPAHGCGLAAPQIGALLRVAIIKMPDDPRVLVLINPKIVRRKGERVVREGCLSFDGQESWVKRAKQVRVKATRLDGEEYQIRARGLLAQAIEHECDHLQGVLYVDHEVPEPPSVRRRRVGLVTPQEHAEEQGEGDPYAIPGAGT